MVEVFVGKTLLNKEGDLIDPEETLRNKVVGIYFSAGWCPPCRDFTPSLCDFYTELVEESEPPAQFEIVFISSDKSSDDMVEYYHDMHGDWLALPWTDQHKQTVVPNLFRLLYDQLNFALPGYPLMCILPVGLWSHESSQVPRVDRPSTPRGPRTPGWEPLFDLKNRYKITAVPKLVIVKENGYVITDKGRKQIRDQGLACFRSWLEVAKSSRTLKLPRHSKIHNSAF
ncbi:unnamed protein product [Oncorhynchus mykiss]|uniref:Thioredoxin domain-containing protein n=1 Tax=Oncorhynchus mykiss TaxID=8022 RepID=A0A060XQD5_ONCMY|nr:unnamed protein product [Oncorhynchus mykiss]